VIPRTSSDVPIGRRMNGTATGSCHVARVQVGSAVAGAAGVVPVGASRPRRWAGARGGALRGGRGGSGVGLLLDDC